MKIKRAIALTALVAAAAGISPLAVAQDSGWYIGAMAGQSNFKDCTAPNCDDSDTALGIFGGYQFHKNFAAELGYTDLGKASAPGFADAEATGFELVGVGSFPLTERFSSTENSGSSVGMLIPVAKATQEPISLTRLECNGISRSDSDLERNIRCTRMLVTPPPRVRPMSMSSVSA